VDWLEVTLNKKLGSQVGITLLSHLILYCFVVWQWHHLACSFELTFLFDPYLLILGVMLHDLSLSALVLWLALYFIGIMMSQENLQCFILSSSLVWKILCTYSLASVTCFSQQGQDVLFTHNVQLASHTRFVCQILKRVWCYKFLRYRCFWRFAQVCCGLFFIPNLLLSTWCLRQVAVLPMSPQICTLLPVMHDSLPIFCFFNYFEFIFQFWQSALFCAVVCCHLRGEAFVHQPEWNFDRADCLTFLCSVLLSLLDMANWKYHRTHCFLSTFFFGLKSTLLARQLHQERTRMEV